MCPALFLTKSWAITNLMIKPGIVSAWLVRFYTGLYLRGKEVCHHFNQPDKGQIVFSQLLCLLVLFNVTKVETFSSRCSSEEEHNISNFSKTVHFIPRLGPRGRGSVIAFTKQFTLWKPYILFLIFFINLGVVDNADFL